MKHSRASGSIVKTGTVTAAFYWKEWKIFDPKFPYLLKDMSEIWYIKFH